MWNVNGFYAEICRILTAIWAITCVDIFRSSIPTSTCMCMAVSWSMMMSDVIELDIIHVSKQFQPNLTQAGLMV